MCYNDETASEEKRFRSLGSHQKRYNNYTILITAFMEVRGGKIIILHQLNYYMLAYLFMTTV